MSRRPGVIRSTDASPIVGEEHQDEQEAGGRGRDDEEISRHDLADVISQERAPSLRRRLPPAPQVFRDGRLTDVERIVERVELEAGRVRPSLSLDASVGVILVKAAKHSVRVQADVRNLTDQLTVINFAGLFSGTALAPPRTVAVRLRADC